VVGTEGVDPVRTREVGMRAARLCKPKVAESQLARNARLVVILEERARLRDVRPFGEPGPPPLIVLRDRVILREVEGDDLGTS
jgi:hypothetical protein